MSPDLDQYLEQMSSGKGLPSMSELISQMAEGDSRMQLLAKYFASRENVEPEPEPELIEAPALDEEERKSITALKEIAERMYSELQGLRERNDALAGALGACSMCWGENISCPACGGDGQPGSLAPDPALFSHYVAPTLRRLRSTLNRASGASRRKSSNSQSPSPIQPQTIETKP